MTAMRGFPYRLRLRFREWQTAPDREEQYSYHPTVLSECCDAPTRSSLRRLNPRG